jgi:hypothetical protein
MPAGGDRQGGGKIGYNHLMKTKLIFLLEPQTSQDLLVISTNIK